MDIQYMVQIQPGSLEW